ncbi:MAG: adenosylcobinamide-phosphate synthase CbiB [Desulfobulbus sp.]|jgi:adenosylcobinamide-phosphate synthase|uniref:adenosylcobinamide-phosphate synthase CbiB n=1 Tax=Desulfobulbus sp. TaxID=895 RepID=UPI00283B7087|nr:adenosylcobinamide-phosphate synthase CbiB [Desulfobulbus sp.]MDR2551344.1 adenosylcobinamide-phosphate synthase CbiB [Desulfobulbus sp.]
MTVADLLPWLTIPAAFALDAMLGDPRWLPHPVRWMGWTIAKAEPLCRKWIADERLAGLCFALGLIVGWWGLAALVVGVGWRLHGVIGFAVETVLLFYCLSARSLGQAAMAIHRSLAKGAVDQARSEVAMIVGRDVENYQAGDIARATVETVAENVVDGVLSPLFFAAIGGAPLAVVYKMVNTLDSMVGYKNPRYLLFGRVAARIDDVANFIPARLAALLIGLAARLCPGLNARRALITAWREGSHHASPNAGYPEAAFAGALGVCLNGPNYYHGVLVDKPYIGVGLGAVEIGHIPLACRLMTRTALLGCGAAWLGTVAAAIL